MRSVMQSLNLRETGQGFRGETESASNYGQVDDADSEPAESGHMCFHAEVKPNQGAHQRARQGKIRLEKKAKPLR